MERDPILYNLCGIGNVGLVCISNSAETFLSLDERVKSRLGARLIEFGPYSPSRLTAIPRQRAEFGLAPARGMMILSTKSFSLPQAAPASRSECSGGRP